MIGCVCRCSTLMAKDTQRKQAGGDITDLGCRHQHRRSSPPLIAAPTMSSKRSYLLKLGKVLFFPQHATQVHRQIMPFQVPLLCTQSKSRRQLSECTSPSRSAWSIWLRQVLSSIAPTSANLTAARKERFALFLTVYASGPHAPKWPFVREKNRSTHATNSVYTIR